MSPKTYQARFGTLSLEGTTEEFQEFTSPRKALQIETRKRLGNAIVTRDNKGKLIMFEATKMLGRQSFQAEGKLEHLDAIQFEAILEILERDKCFPNRKMRKEIASLLGILTDVSDRLKD